jgi:hypothetical protein
MRRVHIRRKHTMRRAHLKVPRSHASTAYDNGIAACYRRWDEWFHYWEELMVTPGGYSIPILAAIGNHEVLLLPLSLSLFFLSLSLFFSTKYYQNRTNLMK